MKNSITEEEEEQENYEQYMRMQEWEEEQMLNEFIKQINNEKEN